MPGPPVRSRRVNLRRLIEARSELTEPFSDKTADQAAPDSMDVIAPPPLASAELAVDGTGGCSASGYPPIASPSPPRSPSVNRSVGAIGRECVSSRTQRGVRIPPEAPTS